MNEELEDVFAPLREEKLSDEERAAMHTSLVSFMHEHPVAAPFYISVLDSVAATFARFSRPSGSYLQPLLAVLVLVTTLGIGTSYAAEGTLPGDFLYPIKINVDEALQGALAFSASAQADWDAQIAARRLGEAQALAAQGKLTPPVASGLASAFDQATQNFNADLTELSQSPNNDSAIADAQSNMETTIASQAGTLTQLTDAAPQSLAVMVPLLTTVERQAVAIDETQVNVENMATTSALIDSTSTIDASSSINLLTPFNATSTDATSSINSDASTTPDIGM